MWAQLNDIERIFNAMDLLQGRMNRIFPDQRNIGNLQKVWRSERSGPRTNLYDAGDHLKMKVEVPGIKKEDIIIKIQGSYLEISGTRKSDTPQGYEAHRVERGVEAFSRSFTLPSEVDSSRVEAELSKGILAMTLPKSEAAKPKQITIN